MKEDLWVKNGLIQDPTNIFFDQKVKSEIVVDCKGCYIFPGLIDLQINGKGLIFQLLLIFHF